MQPNATYASYLLRLRQIRNDDRPTWVASIQSTASGEQRLFPSLAALVRFLETEYSDCDVQCGSPPDVTGPGQMTPAPAP